MITTILSFFGGTAFRMIWGELSAWFTKHQDHAHELERLRLQAQFDAEQHSRNMESIRLQKEMQVEVIRVQGETDVSRIDAEGWYAAIGNAMKPTGIRWVDTWNGIIRPMAATIAIYLWVLALHAQGWKMTEWDRELVAAILGFFLADRALLKRGK